jgi:hypothetical protein|nr:MAG TPA: hypothetical protein [Caudoviricetes sp.]
MSKFTDFLNLFKWDPVEDAEEEFNIEKSLNENWDKLDTKLKEYILKLQTDKVDKIEGKSLSTADYTNEEKDKLATIENNSQENIIEKIQKNGVDLKIINKVVNLILSKNDIGLNNVDNTSDLNKPLSNAAKEAIKNRKPAIELLTVSSTAPSTCVVGDKYYNTTTSKIYTATATNTWATTGENPSDLYLYADLEHKELYYYDGTDFKSYGSGKKEIGYVGEEQEGTEVILIEDSDFAGENSVELAKVEQNLTSNSENAVPSVKAVNDGIKTNIVTGQEVATNEYIDGKRVYLNRATFTTPNAVDTWKAMITIPANSEIVNSYQVYGTESNKYPFPFSNNNESMQIYYNSNDGTINVKVNFNYALNKDGYIIVKYTKNT